MTVTTLERPHTDQQDPQDLVRPETFAKLVRYVTEHMEVNRFYASRMLEQTLIFMKAMCDNPGVRIVPDVSVDPGWHAFLMHTVEYAEFEKTHNGGRRLHHVPIMPEDITSGRAMARTIDILTATGYPIDMEFWETGQSCCPPNPPIPCDGGGDDD